MALTPEILFVNVDYLKRLTNLNGSIEDAVIIPSVILAQDKYLQTYTGTKLLDALKDGVKNANLTTNYALLLDTYIRKAVCWWCMVELVPNLYVKIDNGGLVIRHSDDTNAISPDDLQREINNARINAQFYTKRLVEYLCNNSSLYPEYSSNGAGDIHPERGAFITHGLEISGNA